MTRKIPLTFLLFFFAWQCANPEMPTRIAYASAKPSAKVLTGLEVLIKTNFEALQGKRVGLVTNPTGVTRDLVSGIDILHAAKEVNLVALYGPEHGVRGNYSAGAYVESYTDALTGLPVYSLYGKQRKPTPEMLAGVDVLVYDIQDIGCRSYTYISTMGLVMEAAAEQGIEVVILDRPNPLGGLRVEGPLVQPAFTSFVSQYPVPYVYGLTCGELANLLQKEKLLNTQATAPLSVIRMEGWRRNMAFEETGLPWVPASPHIPHPYSAYFYPISGILGELSTLSIGVGYTLPFQTFAAEWITDPYTLAQELNALKLPGILFRPITYKPYYGASKGTEVSGVQVHLTDPTRAPLSEVQFRFLEVNHRLYPAHNPLRMAEESRLKMFDLVCGTDQVRKLFSTNFSFEKIADLWQQDAKRFQKTSSAYYLYD